MISLNDVLLAMSNIPVDDPIAEIWGRGLQGGYRIIEYTGSLPITINANGDALLDYRIYGADGGVGVATENLFDKNANDVNKGYVKYGYLTADGTVNTGIGSSSFSISEYISLPLESETIFLENVGTISAPGIAICFYDDRQVYISGRAYGAIDSLSVQKPSNAILCRVTFLKTRASIAYVGSTVPTNYIPYGYKLPMVTRTENLFDETLNLGYYIDKHFNIGSSVTFERYRSMQVYLPAGTYSLMFGKPVYLVRELIDGGYSEDSFNAQIYTFQCNTDGYVGFSFRNTKNTNWESDPTTVEVRLTASIPIYIGENQLDAIGEYRDYVDFGIQKIARKIREYTFTGNETFNLFAQNAYGTCWVNLRLYTAVAYCPRYKTTLRSSHFTAINNTDANFWYEYPQLDDACNFEVEDGYDTVKIFFRSTANFSTAEECKAYFKEQYDNGTPVKIWFVMKYTVGQYESTDNGKEDPPVPLPQIPTIDGTTIIDYDGDPKPSQMYVKYKDKSDGA